MCTQVSALDPLVRPTTLIDAICEDLAVIPPCEIQSLSNQITAKFHHHGSHWPLSLQGCDLQRRRRQAPADRL